MMRITAAIAILCFGIGPVTAAAETPGETASSTLNGLMEGFFEASLERYPLWATSIGDHRYDDRYTVSIAPDFRADEVERHRRYMEAVRQIDPELLDEEDRVSRAIFLWDRSVALEGLSFPSHLIPMNQFWSASNSFVQLGSGSSFHPFSTVQDYDNWLSRIDGFVDWVDQAIENMRQGMEQGVVLPRILVQKMIPQVAGVVVDSPEDSTFFQPIVNMPASFPAADR
ncbi:MAG: DUF885 family protein, partial [Gammaproteobacteria bacterium]